MNENLKKIQAVKDLLSMLQISPNQNNANVLAIVYNNLDELAKALEEEEKIKIDVEPAVTEDEI